MDGWKPYYNAGAVLAALGLALSAWSHVAALMGMRGPLGAATILLPLGAFVVWIPAALVARRLTKGTEGKDYWNAAFTGCPPWMKHLVFGLAGYALLNFFLVLLVLPPPKSAILGSMTPEKVRGFSGSCMAFYGAAMAILYSGPQPNERQCPQGHKIGPLARRCEECGYYWDA